MFSNVQSVLSQCNTRLRLLYLLIIIIIIISTIIIIIIVSIPIVVIIIIIIIIIIIMWCLYLQWKSDVLADKPNPQLLKALSF